jgi:uncharacterized protein (TIGR03083 family)
MPPITVERWCAEIDASTETLAGIVHGADLTKRVPTCPDWTLRQLATHVGRAHRWAAQIASTRSAEFIPFRQVPDGRFPDDPGKHAPWLRAGAARLIDAVQEAGSDPVWAFGTQRRPARFWARRMAHETAVHRADAELAAGREPVIAADLAADGIDEWLSFMSGASVLGSPAPDPRLAALPDGAVLHVHATDDGLADGAGESAYKMHRVWPDDFDYIHLPEKGNSWPQAGYGYVLSRISTGTRWCRSPMLAVN